MNIQKIAANIRIRPSDRKFDNAKKTAEELGILPKEMPIENRVCFVSKVDAVTRIKNEIERAIDKLVRL